MADDDAQAAAQRGCNRQPGHKCRKVWGLGFGVWGLGFGVWGLTLGSLVGDGPV